MRVLIATGAWHPQVNGLVEKLTSLQASVNPLAALSRDACRASVFDHSWERSAKQFLRNLDGMPPASPAPCGCRRPNNERKGWTTC